MVRVNVVIQQHMTVGTYRPDADQEHAYGKCSRDGESASAIESLGRRSHLATETLQSNVCYWPYSI